MFRVYDGLKVRQIITGTTTQVVNLNDYCNSICIINDGGADVSVEVSGITVVSKAGDNPIDECFEPFNSVEITTTGGSYRIIVRG